jgi:DNA-binding transcriptional ArsR family regulator
MALHTKKLSTGGALQFENGRIYHPAMICETLGFRLECDMAEPLVAHIPFAFDLGAGQRARLLREPIIGSVIPDMLLGIWSGDMPRWNGLNSISRHVLAWLSAQKSASSEEQLCENLLLSHRAASSAVSRLERVGAVTKRDSGEVCIQPHFDVSDSVRLIAIEMKLKKWREALEQAIVYRKFADEAYVVLDGCQVRLNDKAREAFTSNGVGLFLHQGGEFRNEILAASASPIPSVDRLFALAKVASGPYCLA